MSRVHYMQHVFKETNKSTIYIDTYRFSLTILCANFPGEGSMLAVRYAPPRSCCRLRYLRASSPDITEGDFKNRVSDCPI